MLVSVKNKRELFDLIIAHREIIRTYGVRKLGVFGSFARNQANENSDIDLLVRFSKPKGFDWVDAALEIEAVRAREAPFGMFCGGAAGTRGLGISSLPPVRSISVCGADRSPSTSLGSSNRSPPKRPLARRGG